MTDCNGGRYEVIILNLVTIKADANYRCVEIEFHFVTAN